MARPTPRCSQISCRVAKSTGPFNCRKTDEAFGVYDLPWILYFISRNLSIAYRACDFVWKLFAHTGSLTAIGIEPTRTHPPHRRDVTANSSSDHSSSNDARTAIFWRIADECTRARNTCDWRAIGVFRRFVLAASDRRCGGRRPVYPRQHCCCLPSFLYHLGLSQLGHLSDQFLDPIGCTGLGLDLVFGIFDGHQSCGNAFDVDGSVAPRQGR